MKFIISSALLWLGLLLSPLGYAQEEALCAEVKIEILQELTIERQGFEAIMKITNGLDSYSIDDIAVTVDFADDQGNSVTATSNAASTSAEFFIRVDGTTGVNGLVQGSDGKVTDGSIATQSVGEIRWLIIPSENAAKSPQGSLYFVGAELTYSYGGKEETVTVAPDSIVVKPQPSLTLDYFLQEEVIGDDAFTLEVEPPEPFALGLRIVNSGLGTATRVAIESAQPRIVENEQNLLVNFAITESFLNDIPTNKTLLIDFGDIPAGNVETGYWQLESSLSGRFTSLDSRFSHADELGGALTSLVEATNSYFLVQSVQVALPGRDNVRDYLAKISTGSGYRLFESEATGADLANCNACADVFDTAGSLSGSGTIRSLALTGAQAGFNYVKVSDPLGGTMALQQVVRADGTPLNSHNAWISKERNEDGIEFSYFVNVFDLNPTDTYTIFYGSHADNPEPPYIGFIAERTTYEGEQVGFLVQASDPNNTEPAVTVTGLPSGATFKKTAANTYVFSWITSVGQADTYSVEFHANDGALTYTRPVTIQVNPIDDKDGDGMNDDWEEENFGDTSRDGTGDFDDDGILDVDEFAQGTDPKIPNLAPSVPTIASPIFNSVVLQGQDLATAYPLLSVFDSQHAEGMLVWYEYEVFADSAMTEQVLLVDEIAEGEGSDAGQTSVQLKEEDLNEDSVFNDNQTYVWRARAYTKGEGDIRIYSDWVTSQFVINTGNDAPTAPTLSSPANGVIVASQKPLLVVDNSTDLDGDAITYSFVLYDEDNNIVSNIQGVNASLSGQTQWQVPVLLEEDALYTWQATAHDDKGAETPSATQQFLVSLFNHSPASVTLLSPADNAEVNSLGSNASVNLIWVNSEDPEGDLLSYSVELDTLNTFDSDTVQTFNGIEDGANGALEGNTQALVEGLLEDQTYFWRVKASDGITDSAWVVSQFLVSTDNSAPSIPTVVSPGHLAVIETLTPTFEVAPAVDPEGQAVTYRFELYDDAAYSVQLGTEVTASEQWLLVSSLEDNRAYYWRVRSEDSQGAVSDWQSATFSTNENGVDDAPTISFIAPATDISASNGAVEVQWQDADPDSNASIRLHAVDADENTTLLFSDVPEDSDGVDDTFTFELADLPVGQYQLRLTIADSTTTTTTTSTTSIERLAPTGEITLGVNANTLDEAGTQDVAVDVSLSRVLAVGETVTLNFAVDDASELVVVSAAGNTELSYLQFTHENWASAQRIVLRGVDDCELDGSQSASLVFDSVVSQALAYQGVSVPAVAVQVADNEQAAQNLFICDYAIIAQTAVNAGADIDYTLQARLDNRGTGYDSAEALLSVLTGTDAVQQVMTTNTLTFGINGGDRKPLSNETFVVRANAITGLDIAKLQWVITPGEAVAVNQGTDNSDELTGTEGNDVIDGKAGNDIIHAGGGDDTITGGAGSDTMHGEAGNDTFIVEGSDVGVDSFNGGAGYDTILGGQGDDVVRMTLFANDVEEINGGLGNNIISGTGNDDTFDFTNTLLVNIAKIVGLHGNDTIYGSAGDDTIVGGEGDDKLYGNGGNDTFSVAGQNQGNDLINGGPGADTLVGSAANDTFYLLAFTGDYRVETINGAGGTDRIVGAGAGVTFDFSLTTLMNIASIEGTAGSDSITGSADADTFITTAGIDTLSGLGGDDTFLLRAGDASTTEYLGGAGTDTLKGSVESDVITLPALTALNSLEVIDGDGGFNVVQGDNFGNTLDFSAVTLVSIAELRGGAGNDTMTGSALADTFVGGPGSDTLAGGPGDDVFVVAADDDGVNSYFGGVGNDTINATLATGAIRLKALGAGHSIETIDAGSTAKAIEGDDTNNTLDVSNVALVNVSALRGLGGNDTLVGTTQADILVGGNGSDTLDGLLGDDTFVISANDTGFDTYLGGGGSDTIDAALVAETIWLAALDATNSIEIIDGGASAKTITANSADNTLDFSATSLLNIERIQGMGGADTLIGSAQDDTLEGGDGSDTLNGGAGDDTFIVSADDTGTDAYDGGTGFDTVDVSALTGDFSFSQLVNIEAIQGGVTAVALRANGDDNVIDFSAITLTDTGPIHGLAGDDTITGSGNDDVIIGGDGNDTLLGGDGDDTFEISADDTGVDTYNGGVGDDTIDASQLAGPITLKQLLTSDSIEVIDAGSSDKVIQGTAGNNILDFSATQLLNISAFNGLAGNDVITTTDADETLTGGADSDTLKGEGGDDRYLFSAGSGSDIVNDLNGRTTLVLTDVVNATGLTRSVSGGNLMLSRNDTADLITLTGAMIDPTDFYVEFAGGNAQPIIEVNSQYSLIQNYGDTTALLNVSSGALKASTLDAAQHSAHWLLEPDGAFFRLRNREAPTAFVHNESGDLDAGAILPSWQSAQWSLLTVSNPVWPGLEGKVFQLRNRQNPALFAQLENGNLSITTATAQNSWWIIGESEFIPPVTSSSQGSSSSSIIITSSSVASSAPASSSSAVSQSSTISQSSSGNFSSITFSSVGHNSSFSVSSAGVESSQAGSSQAAISSSVASSSFDASSSLVSVSSSSALSSSVSSLASSSVSSVVSSSSAPAILACETTPGNLVNNCSFANGNSDWTLSQGNGGSGAMTFDNAQLKLDIFNAGSIFWSVQAVQSTPTSAGTYTLSFEARADSARLITVNLGETHSYVTSYFREVIELTPQMQTFTFTIAGVPDDSTARLDFNVGDEGTAAVYLDNVYLGQNEQASSSASNSSVSNSSIASSLSSASSATGQSSSSTAVSDYTLQYSFNNGRSAPQGLEGASLLPSGDVYIFTSHVNGDNIRTVSFYLDDIEQLQAPIKSESVHPYDFVGGGSVPGTAAPFDLGSLSVGSHTVTAVVVYLDDAIDITTEHFSVAVNSSVASSTASSSSLGQSSSSVASSSLPVSSSSAAISSSSSDVSSSVASSSGSSTGSVDCTTQANNLVNNCSFSGGASWTLKQDSGTGSGALNFNNDEMEINIIDDGDIFWSVQAVQSVPTTAGTYTLSFEARADSTRFITVNLGETHSYVTSYFREVIELTPVLQTFTFTIANVPTESTTRLDFNAGDEGTASVYIDNVYLGQQDGSGGSSSSVGSGEFNCDDSNSTTVTQGASIAVSPQQCIKYSHGWNAIQMGSWNISGTVLYDIKSCDGVITEDVQQVPNGFLSFNTPTNNCVHYIYVKQASSSFNVQFNSW